MTARIYRPTKNAMQSGKANTKKWILEYTPDEANRVYGVMGWQGSGDTQQQVKIKFASQEDAENYAKRYAIAYELVLPQEAEVKIQAYADNFK